MLRKADHYCTFRPSVTQDESRSQNHSHSTAPIRNRRIKKIINPYTKNITAYNHGIE